MINHSEMSTHTSSLAGPPRPPPHYQGGRAHDERHLDGGAPNGDGVDYTPRPPGPSAVRMTNASTNTPRCSRPPADGQAPVHATHGQQHNQQPPQPHRQPSVTFSAHPQAQQQHKKRGPKVGSRRASGASLGTNATAAQRAANNSTDAPAAAASAGWQHDPLPAPLAKCNSSGGGTRQAAAAATGPASQHDPYAFHCDSAAPPGAQPALPPSESYQDNGGLDFVPRPGGDPLRQSHHDNHNNDHHHDHHHHYQSRKPGGFINLNELQHQTQHQATHPLDRVVGEEQKQPQGRQRQHIDGDEYYSPANNRRFQSNSSNCGRNYSPENDSEQQTATARVGGASILTTSCNKLAPQQREKQEQQTVLNDQQQQQSGYVRMIAHHHKPPQAGPPQTVSQMQMQSTSPPPSSSSVQQRTTATNQQHNLTSNNQIQHQQSHHHQHHHHQQQQAPQPPQTAALHHHQQHPHNHHHNQAATSEQHQQFSGNYNNYNDRQQQQSQQQYMQTAPVQQQDLYRAPTNSGATMMPGQQQQRFAPRQQYQTVTHHPEPGPPPPSHGSYRGPDGFPAGDQTLIMGPDQTPTLQVPRANHQSHHNNHHHHLQQQPSGAGGRPVPPPQQRVVGPPPSQQHIPVRPNATGHVGGVTAPGPGGPNPRLAGYPPNQQPQQLRNQIPKAAQVMNHPPMVGGGGVYHQDGPMVATDMGPMMAMHEPPGGYVHGSSSPTLLQQQLNRRGPPPPMSMPHSQRHQMMQNKQPTVRPGNFGPAQQHGDLYPPPPPPTHQQIRPAPPSKRPQIVRQQVINQHQHPQQHLMNVGPPPAPAQLDNQHPHFLCNPTPPLTPNAIHHPGPPGQGGPPLPAQQQQVHHQRLHQHQDEWQQVPLNIGQPLSEQSPHLPPSQHHHQQQQHHNGVGGNASFSGGPAPPPPHIKQHRSGPVDAPAAPQQLPKNSMMPKTAGPHTIQYHPTTSASNLAPAGPVTAPLATPSSQLKFQQQHQQPAPGMRPHNSHIDHHHHHHHHQQQQQQQQPLVSHQAPVPPTSATRLTLPLRDGPLVGPFQLEHGVQYDSRSFHIKGQLMDTLSKSLALAQQQQTAAVIQELQFRAYLINHDGGGKQSAQSHQGESLLANPNQSSASSISRACNWPDLFQVSINGNLVQLDRGGGGAPQSKGPPGGAPGGVHRAVDVFQYCQLGDNVIEFQVNDCYCNHEFVLELVDRPTLKAFMNSCFKSRTLSQDSCLSKLKYNFGAPGFIPNLQQLPPDVGQLLQSAGVHNEYLTEFVQGQPPSGDQITRVKISLRCPISARRMTTPARGPNCKHLQCFDLENFLFAHRDRTSWACPVCAQPIPFNMLELDAYQISILQEMCNLQATTDDVLIDPSGLWQAYYGGQSQPAQSQAHLAGPPPQPLQQHQMYDQPPPPPPPAGPHHQPSHHHQPSPVKANGTFHPQAAGSPMPRPMSGHGGGGGGPGSRGSPAGAHWDMVHASPQQHQDGGHRISPLRRPPSAISGAPSAGARNGQSTPPVPTGRRSANGSSAGPAAKRPAYLAAGHPQSQLVVASPAVPASSYFDGPTGGAGDEDLSPLAAMERTIIQHEQQMGPPPFDPNSLTGSSPLRSTANTAQQQQPAAQTQQQVGAPVAAAQSQPAGGHFSPSTAAAASPLQRSLTNVPASPLSRQQQPGPNSPQLQQTQVPSTPATPLVHMGPETPATPGSSVPCQQQQQQTTSSIVGSQQQQQQQQQQSPHVANNNINTAGQCVEHQPLSNGSASAASITSCSTMTPSSGHSLGSVGMGGDSRCNTAPLQSGLGGSLDDLAGTTMLGGSQPGGSGDAYSKQQVGGGNHQQTTSGSGSAACSDLMGAFDAAEKNETLMSKFIMDSDPDSMLHRNSELALALEEAQWKQQLDRGKSEHLANFLNDPLMMNGSGGGGGGCSNNSNNNNNNKNVNHQYHHHSQLDGANKMLSGGLNPSDDEGGQHSPHGSSPADQTFQHHSGLDQPLDHFASYLDSGSADDGAGLPPDDSILDLFER